MLGAVQGPQKLASDGKPVRGSVALLQMVNAPHSSDTVVRGGAEPAGGNVVSEAVLVGIDVDSWG